MTGVMLHNVNKIYPNGMQVLHDINLDIKDGEFMVIVGPSGCAKSTMLRMIAGLEEISSGELTIADRKCNDVQPKDRGIAMVFQNYALYPHMTVYENMAFGLKVAKKTKAEIAQRVNEAAELLEITDLLQRKPKEMSGGQCQRVALGRAMVRKPAVFLFDEPLSNLDAKLRVSMRLRISKLHQQLRESGRPATMIYVTHDQVEAMTMGERVCILRKGKIMQVDRPMNVYRHPLNKFVAEFVGSPAMNMFSGRIEEYQEQLVIRCGEYRFPLPADKVAKSRSYLGREIDFGIRPEDISISRAGVANALTATVIRVDAMGSDEFIYFNLMGQQAICKRPNPEDEIQINETCHFSFNLDKCHLFDKESEKNILYI
ncbi:ABC transporter ATP-binding protein [Yersinia pseudotuberculosis]|uniref:ABC transporter ATP-binding protein n=1 Tax=Yersinia pseudotuberculosis TaxID=633 RepID=UPI0005DE046D|nr:ABC transporter ATP-binding protein [Yersinia pseudotuberculosis]CNC99589.1 ABC transporter ATP-binding protein [Yersinia pseudotuberculosis]CNI44216.1 ABC transporter ATP-binding protein [Yersinia pseudotuberculosis]CNI58391.1 ABC transporter ATP-binding protein [Yersinia pseudotuberculosis]VEE70437.1 ABC transporter ATP-binding protein [Yersinia pseudotuberculosis]